MIWIYLLFFVVGLAMLIKGGDKFVDGASGIAKRFHLPELLIGATVVSIGTTLPEVMVSASDAMSGSGGIAYGNAIGSIICNTALIAAVTITIKPAKTERKALILPTVFFFASAVFYSFVAYYFNKFQRWVGIVLLCIFIIYMISVVLQVRRNPSRDIDGIVEEPDASPEPAEDTKHVSFLTLAIEAVVVFIGGTAVIIYNVIYNTEKDKMIYIWMSGIVMAVFTVYAIIALILKLTKRKPLGMINDLIYIVIGAGVIAGGAKLLVAAATYIAEKIGVPETVIGLTIVALGTSLPELVTAITSLIKGHGALSLGNIIGANLFNLVLVSGVATTISQFDVPSGQTIAGIPLSFIVDIPVMLGVMLILTLPALIRKKLSRVQGILLLCIYAAFCVFQFVI